MNECRCVGSPASTLCRACDLDATANEVVRAGAVRPGHGAQTHDDPELGADPMRNNDFVYGEMDPIGYACPLGSHARRLNPRDTEPNPNRHRLIRRSGTYGPALPEADLPCLHDVDLDGVLQETIHQHRTFGRQATLSAQ